MPGIVRSGRVLDGAIVVALLAVDVGAQLLASNGMELTSPPLGPVAIGLAVASAAVFWWRRQSPLAVFVAAVVLAIVAAGWVAPGLATQQSGATVALAAYAVGSWSVHRRWSIAVPAVMLALFVVGSLDDGAGVVASVAASLAVIALPRAVGEAVRNRRRYVEQVEQRLAEVERERDERARRAVLEERTRLARELHDVVAHHVSLIGVQAGAARMSLGRSPEATGAALTAIESASRSAVHEMRQLLDVLRTDRGPPGIDPQPGLADVDELVGRVRAAGVDVELLRTGEGPPLSPLLELCCYRIVEEALTNATRHSDAGRARVCIERLGDRVVVAVTDPGPPRPTGDGRGRGLAGMDERAALVGGSFRAGPIASGGYAVRAELPVGMP